MNAIHTIDQYATANNWADIDALGSRTRRAKGVVEQRRLLRDGCTLRDVNDEVIPFEAYKGELVERPDRRKELRNDMKHTNSLTGEGGVQDVLHGWGVVTIAVH